MKPDFSGEYVLDRAASVLGPAASAITTAVLRIELDETRFNCSARFASAADAVEFTFSRVIEDGEGVVSASEDASCHWEEDALVTMNRMGPPEAVVVMVWRYELTDGGRRLRATERMRGGGRDQDNVWEFTRQ